MIVKWLIRKNKQLGYTINLCLFSGGLLREAFFVFWVLLQMKSIHRASFNYSSTVKLRSSKKFCLACQISPSLQYNYSNKQNKVIVFVPPKK